MPHRDDICIHWYHESTWAVGCRGAGRNRGLEVLEAWWRWADLNSLACLWQLAHPSGNRHWGDIVVTSALWEAPLHMRCMYVVCILTHTEVSIKQCNFFGWIYSFIKKFTALFVYIFWYFQGAYMSVWYNCSDIIIKNNNYNDIISKYIIYVSYK